MKRIIKSKIVKWTFVIFFTISLIAIFYTVLSSINLNALSVSLFFYMLGRLSGLIGFLFLSVLIFSGETARFFDRFFGMDKIIKFQRKFALITTIFVLMHPIFFILSGRIVLRDMIPNFAVIPLAFGAISLYLYVIIMISSILYKRISYKIWQYIHILIYLLFFFSLYHAVNIGSDSGFISIKVVYAILFVSIMVGVVYRTNYKIKQRKNKFYVKKVKWETKDTFTLILRPNRKFKFKAGQFCFLRLNKDKLYARHPFTISSSPQEKDLQFTIKLAGRFTKIASKLKKREEVIVEGPFGIFTVEDKEKDLIFIAGGVGIAPFFSIIKNQVDIGRTQNILLLYGSKTMKDIIFKKELDKINKKWFKKTYILSEDESALGMCEKGFIDKSIIKKYVKDINNSLFYICGPEQMKDCVKKALAGLGVKKHNIIIEDFFW